LPTLLNTNTNTTNTNTIKMHIYISGGSGRNGQLTIQSALSRGHTVTALVRNPSSLTPHPSLTIIQGKHRSEKQVEHHVLTEMQDHQPLSQTFKGP
jgi:putative NADH-flavin reductase